MIKFFHNLALFRVKTPNVFADFFAKIFIKSFTGLNNLYVMSASHVSVFNRVHGKQLNRPTNYFHAVRQTTTRLDSIRNLSKHSYVD
jgi:hypothetical protein